MEDRKGWPVLAAGHSPMMHCVLYVKTLFPMVVCGPLQLSLCLLLPILSGGLSSLHLPSVYG